MEKNCLLIGTLPNLNDKRGVHEMMRSKEIDEVRFNSGVNQLMGNSEIVETLNKLREIYQKRIWIDLKGRQLRINAWADPRYEAIELNHNIDIEYPAKVIFRENHEANIIHTRGNKIILDRAPFRAVGKGQAVNIIAKSLDIKGYLTDADKELIKLSKMIGINDYMASFVESYDDLMEIIKLNPLANIVSKIESVKGMRFVDEINSNVSLMAARDDLFNEFNGDGIKVLKALREIISKDDDAICASKIFNSLSVGDKVQLSDFEDLELMYNYGYRNFMLGDEIKGEKLSLALKGWRDFV